jgi:hypothetical protein
MAAADRILAAYKDLPGQLRRFRKRDAELPAQGAGWYARPSEREGWRFLGPTSEAAICYSPKYREKASGAPCGCDGKPPNKERTKQAASSPKVPRAARAAAPRAAGKGCPPGEPACALGLMGGRCGAPYLLAAASQGKEWDLRPAFRAAARDLILMRANDVPTVEDYLRQGSLISDVKPAIVGVEHGRAVLQVLQKLGNSPAKFATFARTYGRGAAQNPKGQEALFASEVLTPTEALKRAAKAAGVDL